MERAITRKNVGYFGCLYAGYLKVYYHSTTATPTMFREQGVVYGNQL